MNTQKVTAQEVAHEAHDPKEFVKGISLEKRITINRPVEEVYHFWRHFENLPQILRYVQRVDVINQRLSHWTINAPAQTTVEWDAEIVDERENELITWRTLEGSEVANAGNVIFKETSDGKGTELIVSMQYEPPGGKLGEYVAWLLGTDPEDALEEDLQRFKELMESANFKDTKELPERHENGEAISGKQNRIQEVK